MPLNITTVLNDQIRRIAKREITGKTQMVRRQTTHHRRDIAALKRQVAELQRVVAFLEQQERKRIARPSSPPINGDIRFRADGLRSHRARIGLSAHDYGRLVGASGLSIYHWESGKTRPRKEQVAKLAAVRGLGKREAMKRLAMLSPAE